MIGHAFAGTVHSIAHRVMRGIRLQGLRYLLTAPRNELANPRLRATLMLRAAIARWRDRWSPRQAAAAANPWSDDTLQFFFDLAVSPVTFDMADYLAAAEVERRRRGLGGIVVIIVPGLAEGLRVEEPAYEAVMDRAARQWRLRHIVIPMLALLPSVRGYVVCGSREEANALMAADETHVYPEGYRVFLPRQPASNLIQDQARSGHRIWPLMRATERARRFIAEFLEREARGRKPVVITLRGYRFLPERNSRASDWLAFADDLDASIYVPVFVPDTESAMRPPAVDLSRHVVCEAAIWDLEIRMALYEAAHLNLALMHGPLALCWYNADCRYVIFINMGVAAHNSEAALREHGHEIDASLPFATPFQRLVWAADELAIIRREFAAMVAAIETAAGAA